VRSVAANGASDERWGWEVPPVVTGGGSLPWFWRFARVGSPVTARPAFVLSPASKLARGWMSRMGGVLRLLRNRSIGERNLQGGLR
jgi:hypothetical protein